MNHIVPNILEFEGEPFIKLLRIINYFPKEKEFDYYELGKALRNLRSKNREIPIIQYENSLISVEELKDDIRGTLESFEIKEEEILPYDFKEKDIIKRLIGEMIAVQLRNSTDNLWKVEERYNNVFEASDSTAIQKFGEIELYPGFTFSPIVLPNGKAGVIVDLKHKFHSVHDLRQRILSGHFSYSEYKTTRRFTDICPLSIEECEEKRDPFSTCMYAGTGKTVPIRGFAEIKPSEVFMSSGENLLDYHNRKDICLKAPRGLPQRITDDLPVAISDYISDEGDYYTYPIERLREIPSYNIINEEDRKKVMNIIRPDVNIRYSKTIYYMLKIKSDKLGNHINIKPKIKVKEWVFTLKQDKFPTPELIVGNNAITKYPSFYIEKNGLFDKFDSNKNLYVKCIYFSDFEEKKIELISDLFRKDCTQRITSFYKFAQIPTEILEPEKIVVENQIDSILESLKRYEHACILLIHSEKDKNFSDIKKIVEKKIVEEHIPKQGINMEEFIEKVRIKQISYLKNIYLGIIAKIGLMAWLLNLPEDKNMIYIGLSSKFFKKECGKYTAGICFYNNLGRFLKGNYINCNKDEILSEYKRILSNFSEDNSIILMKRGRIWGTEYINLISALEMRKEKPKILEIVSSPLRLYSMKEEKAYLPVQGSNIILSDTEIGLVTTRAIQGTKDPILINTVNCKLEGIKNHLQNIFALTQCYTGWEKYTTKYPVPIHSSDRVLKKGISFNLDSIDFNKAWFI